MNKAELRADMARHSDTQETLAKALGLHPSGLNARINGHVDFRASEIMTIVRRYHLSPERITLIFFDGGSSYQDEKEE